MHADHSAMLDGEYGTMEAAKSQIIPESNQIGFDAVW